MNAELFIGVTTQQVKFSKLVALGYDPETGNKIKSLTQAAIICGIGGNKDSARKLASRYNQNPKIKKKPFIEHVNPKTTRLKQAQQEKRSVNICVHLFPVELVFWGVRLLVSRAGF